MSRKKYLIVTAGGSGSRMKSLCPKQFLFIGEKPVLRMTIEKFVSAIPDIKVITVLPEEFVGTWKKLCYEGEFSVPQTIVTGGFTRFHSVKNGLEKVPDGAIVAIHDGVRPFVSEGLIRSMFESAETLPAVVPVVPCTDTMKTVVRTVASDGSAVLERVPGETVDRSRLAAVQTPQIFHSELIKKAYSQAFDTSFTDDSSVAERYDAKILYTEGEKFNIKITTPDDLVIAEALCRRNDFR